MNPEKPYKTILRTHVISHLKKVLILSNTFSLIAADATEIHRNMYVIGMMIDAIMEERTELKATAAVYSAADLETPPLAASAAVKTGNNSFP
jgi:hypothetical protein